MATPTKADLQEKIAALNAKAAELRQAKRKSDQQAKILRDEVRTLTKEVQRLNVELEKVRHPPLVVGTVLDALEDGRVVIKSTTGPNFVVPVADFVDKVKLSPGSRVSLSQNTLTVVGLLPSSRDPSVQAAQVTTKPATTYADIGGMDETVLQVKETVELPLTKPELFAAVGIAPPKGVLLRGPPGTGKTLLAKAVANATEATFIRVVASELVQKFIGEGARKVREVFLMAREMSPSILFIDEIDAVGSRRSDDGTTSNREVERTLMQLLAELDGFEPRGDVRIIAATNRADTLDPALLRPGRFDRIIDVPLPSPEGTRAILHIHTKEMTLEDIDLDLVSRQVQGRSGAEIRAICVEAGMNAIRHDRRAIIQADFDKAIGRDDAPADAGTQLYA